MKKRLVILLCLAVVFGGLSTFPDGVNADPYQKSFVRVATGAGPGLLYQTPGDPRSHIGLVVMHPSADVLDGINATELAKRGYTVLAVNTTFGTDNNLDFDSLLLQVRNAVKYLRALQGVTKVVLLGHSGGGPTMAAYQNIAQHGVSACRGETKIIECPDSLANLPPADGLVLLDPVLGMGAQTLVTIDPAVVNEEKGRAVNPTLDMYNPANGFTTSGATYSKTFIHRFTYHQKKRMDELIEEALHRLSKIKAGIGDYSDDEPFTVPGGVVTLPQLWSIDISLWSHTHNAHKLVHPDGSITTEMIQTVRLPNSSASGPVTASFTPLFIKGARDTSVRRFLNSWACRATANYGYDEDSVSGIDWHSTYNSTPGNVEGVMVPLLVVGMGAGTLLVSNEVAYEHAASFDKDIVYIEGAIHVTLPIKPQYGDTKKTTFDYIGGWLDPRF
jgi:pimeloyl-ACP methyl ester carboxylesterase